MPRTSNPVTYLFNFSSPPAQQFFQFSEFVWHAAACTVIIQLGRFSKAIRQLHTNNPAIFRLGRHENEYRKAETEARHERAFIASRDRGKRTGASQDEEAVYTSFLTRE